MIHIRKQKTKLTISGHAYYAPPGEDIVCAMVSCLLWSLIDSSEKGDLSYSIADGEASLKILRETPELKARINMFMTGLCGIAREYPEYVLVETPTTRPSV